MFLARCQKSRGELEFERFLAFSIYGVFGKLKHRLGMKYKRLISDTETVLIPGKISIVSPQVLPTGRGKTPEAPLLREILGKDWRNRTRYRNEIVIGGTQWKR
ncbi:hypothetical protein E2C01_044851 [Portunus trituberculatus]|uniref:Uncharacterized protein n=1 Tax=Portunus trituberculatus TaxID=210409 RepID=A0A5B7G0A3_PORTR|nr:hypothetical protein [Portunus trituberculatus]